MVKLWFSSPSVWQPWDLTSKSHHSLFFNIFKTPNDLKWHNLVVKEPKCNCLRPKLLGINGIEIKSRERQKRVATNWHLWVPYFSSGRHSWLAATQSDLLAHFFRQKLITKYPLRLFVEVIIMSFFILNAIFKSGEQVSKLYKLGPWYFRKEEKKIKKNNETLENFSQSILNLNHLLTHSFTRILIISCSYIYTYTHQH